MEKVNVRKQDEILMSLVHYFVTKEGYAPIYVQGVKDEIWLENIDGPYRIIRINSNYIHNEEQYKYDEFKIKNIMRQIKKKTLSFKVNTLNINLNVADRVKVESEKNIDNVFVKDIDEIKKNKEINEIFPNMKNDLYQSKNSLDLLLNVTNDINKKTETDNKKYEKIFSRKKILITYIIIAICILMYIITVLMGLNNMNLLILGANNIELLKHGQVYRLITYGFLHGSIIHLISNMYCLYVIGSQVENNLDKKRFLTIYFISMITGGLLSALFNDGISIGASGAIFGLLGALLYFGFHFRLYLSEALKTRIIPVIILNLIIGFAVPGIDVACHIGGLIGGFLSAMMVGIPDINNKKDKVNGTILLLIFIGFMAYLIFR
mgnify:FL=1